MTLLDLRQQPPDTDDSSGTSRLEKQASVADTAMESETAQLHALPDEGRSAVRIELDRMPGPSECPGCGGEANCEGEFSLTGAEGRPLDVDFELYRCATCGKCHAVPLRCSRTEADFDPLALEKYEKWKHDNDIVWVGDTSDYDDALAGLRTWLRFEHACQQGRADAPDLAKSEAMEGRKCWDRLMKVWAGQEIRHRSPYLTFDRL
jgi:predicted nucleic-acid-binding Zn-ribbon protein